MKPVLNLFTNLLLAVMVGVGMSAAAATGGIALDPMGASLGVFGLGLAANAVKLLAPAAFNASGLTLMAVQVEIWQDTIMENLFKGNEFLQYSVDVSSKVLGGKVVHIPQAGSKPQTQKNRSVYPAVAVQRTDTDVTYTLDGYSTDPTHIADIEQAEISYDKRASVYKDHFGELGEVIAEDLLYKWSATQASNRVFTTGTLVGTSLAPGATGTRRQLKKEDLVAARGVLTKSKVKGNFIAVVPTDLFQELLADADFIKANAHLEREIDLTSARIAKWGGMNIVERVTTTVFDNANAPKAPGAATATTDKQAVICWVDQAVEKGVGTIKFYENIADALYYGDVYSAEVRSGGRIRRADEKGVAVIIQAAS
jgi:hypothetical protein